MLRVPRALLRWILIRHIRPLITLSALMSAVITLAPSPPASAGEGMAGLGLGWDHGGFDAPGFSSGPGVTLECGYYWTVGVGLFACTHGVGYERDGESRVVFWAAGELRYRHYLGSDASAPPRWFVSAGAGFGIGYSQIGYAGLPALATPVLFEFGVRLGRAWVFGLDLALRDHATLFIVGGDPPLDIINSIEFFVSIVGGVSN